MILSEHCLVKNEKSVFFLFLTYLCQKLFWIDVVLARISQYFLSSLMFSFELDSNARHRAGTLKNSFRHRKAVREKRQVWKRARDKRWCVQPEHRTKRKFSVCTESKAWVTFPGEAVILEWVQSLSGNRCGHQRTAVHTDLHECLCWYQMHNYSLISWFDILLEVSDTNDDASMQVWVRSLLILVTCTWWRWRTDFPLRLLWSTVLMHWFTQLHKLLNSEFYCWPVCYYSALVFY